ncbi:MAG: STAS domain-containing protein [Sulfuritalea sp.]|nr:STAS domain-containing protein [Sulfuritalea sp.]
MKIVATEAKQGVRCIALDGRLDAAGVQAGEAEFNSTVAASPNVIVDLEKVPFIASIGVRMLVAAAQAQSKMGGKMVMVNPDDATRRILKTTGIDQVIPVFDNTNAALGGFA